MKKMLKIIRYQLSDTKKALIIYYSILMCSVLVTAYFYNTGSLSSDSGSNRNEFNGIGISAAIFLFVSGLNSFKANFKFLQAHGISRITQYKSSILTFLLLSLLMTVISLLSAALVNFLMPYRTFHKILFPNGDIFQSVVWTFSLYFFCLTMGWFITMLYYRCGKLMKTLISLIPVYVIIILSIANNMTDGESSRGLLELMKTGSGLKDGNSMIGSLSFFIISALFLSGSYLLIRRAPLKD